MTPDELHECIKDHPDEYLEFMREFERKLERSRELHGVCYTCNFPMLKDYCINCKIMKMEK